MCVANWTSFRVPNPRVLLLHETVLGRNCSELRGREEAAACHASKPSLAVGGSNVSLGFVRNRILRNGVGVHPKSLYKIPDGSTLFTNLNTCFCLTEL
jgi:hypothetical protein